MIAFYALTADRTNLIGHPIGDPADGTDWLRRRAGIPISPAVGKANTDHVLDVLGLPPTDEHGDAYGDEPADAGTPATVRNVDDGFGGSPILTAGGRWHDMGRAPGYTDRKLAELRTFAEWCAARGHRVAWA